ncbi:MAG: hypothetical protein FJ303_26675 [Planctomycetes bacterium]|nr:hypothetical protein [Planctomycetota bacterium]
MSQANDLTMFSCEMEACIIAFIHAWEGRAKSFANQFADTRLESVVTASMTTCDKTRERMNYVITQFNTELHSAVTVLEHDALLNKITLMLLRDKLPTWSDADKVVFRSLLSTEKIDTHEEATWCGPSQGRL